MPPVFAEKTTGGRLGMPRMSKSSPGPRLVSQFNAGLTIEDVAWTPKGELLVAVDRKLRLFTTTGEEKSLPSALAGIPDDVWSVAVHVKTKAVAVIAGPVGRSNCQLYVTSLGSGRHSTRHVGLPGWCGRVRFTDLGDVLVGSADNTLMKYNPKDMTQQWQRFTKHAADYITVSRDKIIIRGGEHMSVLSEEGRWLSSFSTPSDTYQLPETRGLCADSLGRVYVSDLVRRQVAIFGPDGYFVREVAEVDWVPRVLALYEDRYLAMEEITPCAKADIKLYEL